MPQFLILLIIFLTPLLTPFQGLGYEQIKVFSFLILVSLLTLGWLLHKPKYSLKFSKVKLFSALFIISLTISSFLGANPFNSIVGSQPYFQGLIVYYYLWLFCLLISSFKPDLTIISKAISVSAFLVSFLAIKDFVLLYLFHQTVPTYAGRVVSTFGQPNFYAGFLLISLPFIFWTVVHTKSHLRLFFSLSLLLSICAIFISGSRSCELILFLALFISLFKLIKSKIKYLLSAFVVLSIILTIIFSFQNYAGIFEIEMLKPLQNRQWVSWSSPEKRVFIWPVIIDLISQKPLLGYGIDSLGLIWADHFAQLKPELGQISALNFDLQNLVIDRSHNYLLDILIFSGAIGLFFWLGLVLITIRSSKNGLLLSSLLLYLIFIQFQNQSIVHLIYFWLLVGLIDHVHETERG